MMTWLRRAVASVRVRPLRWLACLALAGLAGTLIGLSAWFEYHFRAGRTALEQRDFPRARRHLARCSSLWSRGATTHLLAARAARGVGAYDEAEGHLEQAERLGADPASVRLEEYLLDAQRGRLSPQAEQLLNRRVAQGHPAAADILDAMTQGYLYTYRLGEAQACVERWLAQQPDSAQALYLRGLIREGMQRLAEAGADYERAVELDPAHSAARLRLGEYLLSANRSGEAAEQFEELHRRDPDNPAVMLGLARCRRLQGRNQEARTLLDALSAGSPRNLPALKERALLARSENDPRAAEHWYRQAADVDPYDAEICLALAHLVRRRSPQEAARLRQRARAIEADLDRLYALHAKMARKPGDAQLRYEAAVICLRNGQKAEGRRWLLSTLRIDPGHGPAREALAKLAR
jgi:tetratricopeptide (TPR) repeat protein